MTSVALALGGLGLGLPAASAAPGPPDVAAEASIVVDAATGTVIAAERPDARRPIASATKLMTALLTIERTKPRERLTASGYVAAPIESQIGLEDGERMAVRDLLVALLLESANDAADTLAAGIAGSTDAFVEAMNERAAALGLDDTSYETPIGFDHPDNFSSARDLAQLAGLLIERRRFADIVEEPSLKLRTGDRPRVLENRNELVGAVPGVDGVKTGHTQGAGYVLVGSAERDGARVVSVVLGAPSEAARDEASTALIDHGLDQFRERRVVAADGPLADAALAHRDERVRLVAGDGITLTVLRDAEVETRVEAPNELDGPLPAGEDVGRVDVLVDGEVVRSVPVVTASPVEAVGLTTRVASTLADNLLLVFLLVPVALGLLVLVVPRARARRARRPTELVR